MRNASRRMRLTVPALLLATAALSACDARFECDEDRPCAFGSVCAALMALAYYRWGGWRRRPLMLAGAQPTPEESQLGE